MIAQFGDPILKKKASVVVDFQGEAKSVSKEILSAIEQTQAYGLAAQHIKLSSSVCVINLPQEILKDLECELDGIKIASVTLMPLVLVNPKYLPNGEEKAVASEGSVSFAGIEGGVERYSSITVEYQDLEGAPHSLVCRGMFARCVQHEVDQLEGILFIEKMSPRVREMLASKLKKLKRSYRSGA